VVCTSIILTILITLTRLSLGKTATIVALVRILAAVGYSVLVSSHTNSAVDNVLCKLLPFDLNILRLGASSKVAPSLKELTESALLTTANSFEHLDQLMSQKVIFIGCKNI